MNPVKRSRGKLIRHIAKLDRAWRLAGKQEGSLQNELAFALGRATRCGMYVQARRAQCVSAARLGQQSGWEANAAWTRQARRHEMNHRINSDG